MASNLTLDSGSSEKVVNLLREYVETEKTFSANCAFFLKVLPQLQEAFKDHPNALFLGEVEKCFSDIHEQSKLAKEMVDPDESIEKQLQQLKSGYTKEFAEFYFSSLSNLAARHVELSLAYEDFQKTLSESDREKFSKIMSSEGNRQTFDSFLIMPAQRGPRHQMLAEQLNSKAKFKTTDSSGNEVTVEGYFEDMVSLVRESNAVNNRKIGQREKYFASITSVSGKKIDDALASVGELVSSGLATSLKGIRSKERKVRQEKMDYISGMVRQLKSVLADADKRGDFGVYLKEVDRFERDYKARFEKEGVGKVSRFLGILRQDALQKQAQILSSREENVTSVKKLSPERLHLLEDSFNKVNKTYEDTSRYEGLSAQRAQVASQEIGAGVVQRAKDSLSTAAREKATVEPKEMVSAYKKVEEKSGFKGIIASIESKVKQEQEQLKKAKLPKSPV